MATIPADVLQALQKRIDAVTFASPKTARCFYQLIEQAQDRLGVTPQDLLKEVTIAAIGPLTSSTCHKVFGRVDIQPQEYSLNGLISSLVKYP